MILQAQIYTFPTKQPSKNYTFPINNNKKNYTFPKNKRKSCSFLLKLRAINCQDYHAGGLKEEAEQSLRKALLASAHRYGHFCPSY